MDTSSGSGRVEFGNAALHLGGYLTPSITTHIHQWLSENGNTGGLDTFQLAYNFKNDLHLFAGKLSMLPVPAPYSNAGDLTPFACSGVRTAIRYFEGVSQPGTVPVWKGMAWWMVPIGGR